MVHVRRWGVLVLVALAALAAAPLLARAQGGPPLLTDDPGTPGNTHWEINFGFTFARSRTATLLETPRVDFNYGLGDHIQLKYEVPWVLLDPRAERVSSGAGNSLFGVKWRFLDQDRRGVAVSLYPQLEFNNSSSSARRGLVEEGVQFLLPVEVARRVRGVDVNAELGYQFRAQARDEVLYGLAFGHDIRDRLQVLGEIHGTAEHGFADDELLFDLGGRWRLDRKLVLLFTVGRSVRGLPADAPTFFGYLGLQLNL